MSILKRFVYVFFLLTISTNIIEKRVKLYLNSNIKTVIAEPQKYDRQNRLGVNRINFIKPL